MLGTWARGGMTSVVNSYLSLNFENIKIIFIPTHIEGNFFKRYFYFFKSVFNALPYFFDKNTKIIHMHITIKGSILRKFFFLILSKIFCKKTILHMHGADFFDYYDKSIFLWKRFINFVLNMPDKIITLSETRKKEYSKIIDMKKIVVIPNFIEIPEIKKSESKIKNKIPLIISVGRVGERKGTNVLIEACSLIKEKAKFNVEVAGDGDIEKYKKIAEEKNVNIKFLGWVEKEEKNKIYERADIFVLPSYFEDMPMAILEAMSYGIPVISTKIASIPEMVGDAGIIIEPGNPKKLADAIFTLIKNKKLRKSLSEKARKRALIYSKENIKKLIIRFYEEVLNI